MRREFCVEVERSPTIAYRVALGRGGGPWDPERTEL